MHLPAHHLAAIGCAIGETLDAAGVGRVRAIGRFDPQMRDLIDAHLHATGGELDALDCVCGALPLGSSSATCAWLLPSVSNYYAAYRQLHAVRAFCVAQATPFLVLLPHVAGTLARRDHYFADAGVPRAWRRQSEPCVLCGETAERAITAGGLRNGVLTAIEDFAQELADGDTSIAWTWLPAIGGFCALFDVDTVWAPELAYRLAKFHTNASGTEMSEQDLLDYLATMERPARPRSLREMRSAE